MDRGSGKARLDQVPTFDGTNYQLWVVRFTSWCQAQGLTKYLVGMPGRPEEEGEERTSRDEGTYKAFAALCIALPDDLIGEIMEEPGYRCLVDFDLSAT